MLLHVFFLGGGRCAIFSWQLRGVGERGPWLSSVFAPFLTFTQNMIEYALAIGGLTICSLALCAGCQSEAEYKPLLDVIDKV